MGNRWGNSGNSVRLYFSALLIATGEAIPLRGLEGVPGESQDALPLATRMET